MSEEVCSEHSYSRIESGKREPHRKSLEKILNRLELGWGYYSGEIASDEIRCHMVRIKIKLAISRENYDMASRLLEALENMLDLSIPQNRQYVELTHVILDRRLGKGGQEPILFCFMIMKMGWNVPAAKHRRSRLQGVIMPKHRS